ncbi:MAG: alpha-amylase [Lachnospiraceae bacterium]|nr:alpha-amylase [Lachnospiraceae bacterium]
MSKLIGSTISDPTGLYPCRTVYTPNGCRFSLDISNLEKNAVYGVAIYDNATDIMVCRREFKEDERCGNVYSAVIPVFNREKHSYNFFCNEYYITDERAEMFKDKLYYGGFDSSKARKALVSTPYDWEGVRRPHIPFKDMFMYLLHVRGFTMHTSSGVKHKGTFSGLAQKRDYLKKLGVTTVELQPVYEFNENDKKTGRYNYWGYCRGYYYTPKSAYSHSDDACTEFCDMVKAFHKAGMEIVMQMYFPASFSRREIPYILEYWAIKYHIDGFHILGENIPINLISESSILSGVKIFSDNLYGVNLSGTDYYDKNSADIRRYALYRDDYLYTLRRYIKGDGGVLSDVIHKLRNNPADYAVINYLDSYNTLTLADMVSYDHKHNENNGEDNRDGNDYNCSWNCGVEGPTKKPKINALRAKQLKNALTLLFISSGVPLIFMGDEMGNTQMGNNNPYCHDSDITWLDWRGLKRKNSLFGFISGLAGLRKEYSFFHGSKEMSLVDVEGCGYPELSYHGESAWMTSLDNYKNFVGILFSEKGRLFYLAVNMHWDCAELSLPRAPKGCKWEIKRSTDFSELTGDNKIKLSGRTIAEIIAVKEMTGRKNNG